MGSKYQRFELRIGDCFPMDGWNDCENDRERFEFSLDLGNDRRTKMLFLYLKITPNFFDVHPTNTDLGQVHSWWSRGKSWRLKIFAERNPDWSKKKKLVFKWHKLSGNPKKCA